MQHSRLVLKGPPGVAKRAQANSVARTFDVARIKPARLIDDNPDVETARGTPGQFLDDGKPVPDEVLTELIRKEVEPLDGFVLDGYPRTPAQIELLEDVTDVDLVVYLGAADDVLVERLSNRRICSRCDSPFHLDFNPPDRPGVCDRCGAELERPEHDRPENSRQRLSEYKSDTVEVLDAYRERDLLVEIDAERPLQTVKSEIHSHVRSTAGRRPNRA